MNSSTFDVNGLLSAIAKKVWEQENLSGEVLNPTLSDIQETVVSTQRLHKDLTVASTGTKYRVLISCENLDQGYKHFPNAQKFFRPALDTVEHAFEGGTLSAGEDVILILDEQENLGKCLELFSRHIMRTSGEPSAQQAEWLHQIWKKRVKDFPDTDHPLKNIVREWIRRHPPKYQIEKRHKQIAPAFLKKAKGIDGEERLPTGVLHSQGEASQQLPLFEANKDQDIVIHALPIEIYKGESGGRGAPLDERVFFNALLARPYGTPEEYNTVRLEPTLRDFVDWLYPNGWNRTYQLPLLQKALHQVHNKRISYERRDWNVVQVLAMPNETTQLDDILPLIIRYPDGVSGNGPMIDVARMRNYGLVSAPKWRAWIRLHYFWDTAKQRNGGYAIYATRPKVKRDADGYLLDATGNLIVSGNVYKRNSKRYAKKGKEPQTAWYHPQAIHLGVERNPQADKIPVLSREELVCLFFDKSEVDQSTFRRRFKRAVDNLLEFEEEGSVIVEWKAIDTKRGVKGIRILPVLQELDTRSRLS